VWLAATLAFLLAVPSVGSIVAFTAATSIATIGLYLSYGLPILIGLLYPAGFIHGPFTLGKFSRPVALVACLWIGFITIIFCLPELNPINSQTLNYTPVAVGIIGLWCALSWFLWAKKWFKVSKHSRAENHVFTTAVANSKNLQGPVRQIEADMAGIDSDEPGALEKAEKEGRVPHLGASEEGTSVLADMKHDLNK
jgi:hypothetical protein